MPRAMDHILFLLLNALAPADVFFRWRSVVYPVRGKMELEAMSRYTSPVNPAVFPHLTVVLLAIGMFFTAWFFVYPLFAPGGRISDHRTERDTTLDNCSLFPLGWD
ncbi:rCG47273, isoform CRA_a [Rattus norvegicus]|uniref:Dolichyl-diphosphooligosaccharide-protein glycosyltransferase subunit TMEM258 n=1 Tax=Rattus norvegicus TaxID=10116 RepID=A6I014_RAT|nr:rCG47273, isoform CRA_a [Rattus norvegicus]